MSSQEPGIKMLQFCYAVSYGYVDVDFYNFTTEDSKV